jgi:hypothetical protein
LIGLTNLNNGKPIGEPPLNHRRAVFVLAQIDEILRWEQGVEQQKENHFVKLGRYLCEVRSGQYWRVDRLSSFDEFLKVRFPASRRKAYYLMAIHEHLPKQARSQLEQVGWSKAVELTKVARSEGDNFDCATWLHRAQEMTKEDFQRQVEEHLTGKASEPWEIIYFKVYKSQLEVIEQAFETVALMLGSDRARGYCLELICADFLAGVHAGNGQPEVLLAAMQRLVGFLPAEQRRQLLTMIRSLEEDALSQAGPSATAA